VAVVGDFLQPTHLLFVLVVALLVLGPKRLPEAGRALGRGLRDFRSAISGESTPEHTIPGPEASAPTEQPSTTGAETPATSQQQAGSVDTAETEIQAPQETAEPVASSASAEPRT
jgi:sec-independent protein translocase protein TatA